MMTESLFHELTAEIRGLRAHNEMLEARLEVVTAERDDLAARERRRSLRLVREIPDADAVTNALAAQLEVVRRTAPFAPKGVA